MTNVEQILVTVGGMSRFQFVLIFIILGSKILYSWGLMMMSFAGVPPENWWCQQENMSLTYSDKERVDNLTFTPVFDTSNETNSTVFDQLNLTGRLNHCPIGSDCPSYSYSSEKHTVVSEWNLVCDKQILTSTMTAVQMGGLFVGSFLSGQFSDLIGRKKVYFLFMLLHAIFNFVSAFSVSWQMFMALRFPVGLCIGALITVYYPYMAEFLSKKWVPITGSVPFWQLGTVLLALTAWLRPHWSDVHIILAAVHLPFLATWFIAPESLRWLAVHGRIKDAEKVVDQIARYNRKTKPANTEALLRKLAEEELSIRQSGQKYTYVDIYRPWSLCWKSLVMQYIWICMSLVFYGIGFGVGQLTGNLYFNICLIGVTDVPGILFSSYLCNRIGRRRTAFMMLGSSAVFALVVVIITCTVPSDDSIGGTVIRVMAFLSRMSVNAAWNSTQIIISEIYPTPIRNLGFGGASAMSRIGGIMSPYVFTMGKDSLMVPFLIVGLTMLSCALLSLTMPETRLTPLEDTTININKPGPKKKKEEGAYSKVPIDENTKV